MVRTLFFLMVFLLVAAKATLLFNEPYFEDVQSYEYLVHAIDDSGNKLATNNVNLFPLPFIYSFHLNTDDALDAIFFLKIMDLAFFLVFVVLFFMLARNINKDDFSAFFAVIALSITPVLFVPFNSSLRPELLPISLFLLTTYLLFKSCFSETLKNKKQYQRLDKTYIFSLLICSLLMSIFPAYSMLFVLHLILYLVLSFIEKYRERPFFMEFSIFFITLITGSLFFLNSEGIRRLKSKLVFDVIPVHISHRLIDLFHPISIFSLIGVISIVGGIYGAQHYFYGKKDNCSKKNVFLTCGAMSAGIMLLLRIGNPIFLLIYFALMLAIVFSSVVKEGVDHADKFYRIRVSRNSYWIIIYLVMLIGGISVNYSIFFSTDYTENEVSEDIFDLMRTLDAQTAKDSLIIGPYFYGHLIGSVAKRSYILDNDFYTTDNAEIHLENIARIYQNINAVKVHNTINGYVSSMNYSEVYLIFDNNVIDFFNNTPNRLIRDDCFTLEYESKDAIALRYWCYNER